MAEITIQTRHVSAPPFDLEKLRQWLEQVAGGHGRKVGRLTYVFCDDEYILQTNVDYLGHNYYTDIITFDYSTSRRIAGDMVISLDTVKSNAEQLGLPYPAELCRVVVHGVLHLCGIDDKGTGQRQVMEQHENAALAKLPLGLFLEDAALMPKTQQNRLSCESTMM